MQIEAKSAAFQISFSEPPRTSSMLNVAPNKNEIVRCCKASLVFEFEGSKNTYSAWHAILSFFELEQCLKILFRVGSMEFAVLSMKDPNENIAKLAQLRVNALQHESANLVLQGDNFIRGYFQGRDYILEEFIESFKTSKDVDLFTKDKNSTKISDRPPRNIESELPF